MPSRLPGRRRSAERYEKRQRVIRGSIPDLVPHYVEFLNEREAELNVKDGVVRYKGAIWIYLGDGSVPADQIQYQHSRFHLREATWAAKPVVRVSWQGAQAYARHYEKRLPTYQEWQALNQQMPGASPQTHE